MISSSNYICSVNFFPETTVLRSRKRIKRKICILTKIFPRKQKVIFLYNFQTFFFFIKYTTSVDIRHGEITGRKIGDTGDILGLQVLRGANNNFEKNQYQNVSFTKDGRIIRASSVFFKDLNGKHTMCIGINEDITNYTHFAQFLQDKIQLSLDADTNGSYGRGNVNEMLNYLMDEAQLAIGKNTALISKDEKIKYIHFLDDHGAFLITKAGQKICKELDISKYTLYHYLDIARSIKEV